MASIIKVDQIKESTTGVGTNFSNTGSASTPTISIGNQTNKGFYHEGSDKIGISVNGSKVGEINNNGVLNGTLGTEYRNILQIIHSDSTGQNNGTTTILKNSVTNSQTNTNYWIVLQGSITAKANNSLFIITGNINLMSTNGSTSNNVGYIYLHTSSQGNINTNSATTPNGTLIAEFGHIQSSGSNFNMMGSQGFIANSNGVSITSDSTYWITVYARLTSGTSGIYNRNNSISQMIIQEVV